MQCRPALQDAEIESGTGSGLAPGELKESCNGGNNHCIDDSYTGSIKVGPVEAGEVYICGMVASIDGHLDVFNLSDVTTLTGKNIYCLIRILLYTFKVYLPYHMVIINALDLN